MAAILAQDKAMAERKELAQKQKERALAQMQNMQRKFLEKNREQLLNLETSVDEPYALSLLLSPHSFPPPLLHLLLLSSSLTLHMYVFLFKTCSNVFTTDRIREPELDSLCNQLPFFMRQIFTKPLLVCLPHFFSGLVPLNELHLDYTTVQLI